MLPLKFGGFAHPTFNDGVSSLRPEALTWTGLLAQWVRFAQASLALPEELHGERWRASVPAVINLQAVTFALADLDQIPLDDHALALNKAEIIIRESDEQIRRAWAGAEISPMLREIQRDANLALDVRRLS
jgi:hypothetical protein